MEQKGTHTRMRRKEKEITERAEIESLLRRSTVCRLGLSVSDKPYVVPLCFGYADNTLYFHMALEGKKMEMLRQNPNVCFEVDEAGALQRGEKACGWGIHFESVIGFGLATQIDDPGRKTKALGIIMAQYSDERWHYDQKAMAKTAVVQVEIEHMTGKRSQ